jgi:hypothetical protein
MLGTVLHSTSLVFPVKCSCLNANKPRHFYVFFVLTCLKRTVPCVFSVTAFWFPVHAAPDVSIAALCRQSAPSAGTVSSISTAERPVSIYSAAGAVVQLASTADWLVTATLRSADVVAKNWSAAGPVAAVVVRFAISSVFVFCRKQTELTVMTSSMTSFQVFLLVSR